MKALHHWEAAFSENYFWTMIRYGDYKMVYYAGKPYEGLYNLEENLQEQENLWDTLAGSATF